MAVERRAPGAVGANQASPARAVTARLAPLLVAGGAGLASVAVWRHGLDGQTAAFAPKAALLVLLQAAAAAALWRRDDRVTLALVVVFGVAFRIEALGWGPDLSSDLRRYLWDGRVQAAGLDPYGQPPADPRLAGLADEEVSPRRINRPEAVTVYPPGAQAGFRLLHAVGVRSLSSLRRVAVGCDAATLLLLLALLGRARAPRGRLVLWAWSPLAVAEVAVSAHLEALVVPLALAALCFAGGEAESLEATSPAPGQRTRPRAALAGFLLGAAALVKLLPALLLLALPRGRRRRLAAASAGALFLVGYAAYLARAGRHVLGFLPDYFRSGEDFNLGVRGLLQALFAALGPAARPVAIALSAAALLIVLGAIARRPPSAARPPITVARDLLLAFALLWPGPLHPWYALPLLASLVVAPSLPGLWLVAALPLSYLKYGAADGVMPSWVPWIEFAPACLFVFATPERRPLPEAAT